MENMIGPNEFGGTVFDAHGILLSADNVPPTHDKYPIVVNLIEIKEKFYMNGSGLKKILKLVNEIIKLSSLQHENLQLVTAAYADISNIPFSIPLYIIEE